MLRPDDLRGSNLRYCLLTLLWQHGPATTAELRAQLEGLGLTVGGRDPNKTLGDVLRYEVTRGRVRRLGRARYMALPRPDTTTRRHRDRLHDLLREAAVRRTAATRAA